MSKRVTLVLFAACTILAAQDPPTRAGRLSYRSGAVSFQPGGVNDWVDASINRPLTAGDQIFADQGGRAEIQVPGSSIRLGSRSAFEFLNLDDRDVQGKLSEGEMIVMVRDLYGENLEIDTPSAAVSITQPGEYRIDTNPDTNQTAVTVRYGRAEIVTNGGSFELLPRQQAVLNGQSARYQVYAAPGFDDFDNWGLSRDRHEDRHLSTRYVPASVVGYEDLDDYGSWQTVPEYGNLWVPRGLPAEWAPYRDGQWSWVDPWGWTWVDNEPWGFAPFHYGRWAHFGNSWGWAPGPLNTMPVYSPAMVAWIGLGGGSSMFSLPAVLGGGPSVGWFPLGPRDVYIPSYRATPGYVNRINTANTTVINNTYVTNVYNNYVRSGSVPVSAYAYHNLPAAVTAVPQSALVGARPVRQAAIRIDPNQIRSIAAVTPAPRVAPQAASVLGRPTSFLSRAPRPAAAIVTRPVVARSAPPPAASFEARQQALAKNPGVPLPIQQQRQMTAAARGPVQVVAHARPITPVIVNTPAPRPGQVAQANPAPSPAQPAPAPQRSIQAPAARPAAPVAAPQAAAQGQPQRPFEPSSAHPNAPVAPPQQAVHPPVNAAVRPQPTQQPPARAQAQPAPFEPPAGRAAGHQQPPATPAQHRVPPPEVHAYQPPPVQRPVAPPQVHESAGSGATSCPAARAYEAPPVQRPAAPPQVDANQPPAVQHPAPPVRAYEPPPVQRPAPPQVHANQPPAVQHPAPSGRAYEPPPVQRPAPPPQAHGSQLPPVQHPVPPPQAHAAPNPQPHAAATPPPPERAKADRGEQGRGPEHERR